MQHHGKISEYRPKYIPSSPVYPTIFGTSLSNSFSDVMLRANTHAISCQASVFGLKIEECWAPISTVMLCAALMGPISWDWWWFALRKTRYKHHIIITRQDKNRNNRIFYCTQANELCNRNKAEAWLRPASYSLPCATLAIYAICGSDPCRRGQCRLGLVALDIDSIVYYALDYFGGFCGVSGYWHSLLSRVIRVALCCFMLVLEMQSDYLRLVCSVAGCSLL